MLEINSVASIRKVTEREFFRTKNVFIFFAREEFFYRCCLPKNFLRQFVRSWIVAAEFFEVIFQIVLPQEIIGRNVQHVLLHERSDT